MKKLFLLLIPLILLPYIVLLSLALIFISKFEFIMQSVFDNNALILIAVLFLTVLFTAIFTIIYFFLCIKKSDYVLLAKNAVWVKWLQIPAYVIIFVLGVLFSISIFTIPFSIGLCILDFLILIQSALVTLSAVISAVRQKKFTVKQVIWIVILQFVFCADVFAAIYFLNKTQAE